LPTRRSADLQAMGWSAKRIPRGGRYGASWGGCGATGRVPLRRTDESAPGGRAGGDTIRARTRLGRALRLCSPSILKTQAIDLSIARSVEHTSELQSREN